MRDLIFSNLCGERDRCGVGEGAKSRLTTRSCGGQVAAACDLYMCQDVVLGSLAVSKSQQTSDRFRKGGKRTNQTCVNSGDTLAVSNP